MCVRTCPGGRRSLVSASFTSPAPSRSPSGDELLAAVDVVGRAGERRVGHDVHGKRGDVGRSHHAPDGQRNTELVAELVQVIAEQTPGETVLARIPSAAHSITRARLNAGIVDLVIGSEMGAPAKGC